MRVDLPEPEGPMIATYSPRLISMSTPDTAWISWSPMTYVFHKSKVRMTIPSRLSCSPRAISSLSATAATLRLLPSGLLPWTLIIHLYLRIVADRANYLVTSGDDFITFLQPAGHLDVGGARDARFDLPERHLASGHHEHALDLLFA